MFRQLFAIALYSLILFLGVGCADNKGTTTANAPAAAAAGAQRPATVELGIAGGNAIILSADGRRATIGPVKAPASGPANDYNDHEMNLTLQYGTLISSDLPAIEGRPNWWQMTGYDVELCEDGKCPETETLEVPADDPSVGCDASPKGGTLSYAPQLSRLHPGATLKTDWPSALRNRFKLRQGRLYANSVVGCFEFQRGDTVVARHALPEGRSGIRHEFKTTAKYIDAIFTLGSERKTVRFEPKDGVLKLEIRTEHPDEALATNVMLTRFSPFYDLLAQPTDAKVTIFARQPLGEVNPREECPMFVAREP